MGRARNPDVVEEILPAQPATRDEISELAEITNRRGRNRSERVRGDALAVYKWVLRQQSLGRIVTALENPEIGLLSTTGDPTISGEREFLSPMFSPRRLPAVKAYFEKAQS